MTGEELAEVLRSCSPMQLDVVIRRPEDDVALLEQIQELQDKIQDLQLEGEKMKGCYVDNFTLRNRLKAAKKLLKANGLPFEFCDIN